MFEKIYYINLDFRTDRRIHIENEIKKLNFNGPIERINAANGKNLDLTLIPSNLFTEIAIESTTNKNDLYNTSTMTKGGMGVAISHKWIYEKILCGKENYSLILEDDMTFDDNFMEKIQDIFKKIKYFDILYLGYHVKIDSHVGTEFDIPGKIWGLFGYIINKKTAKKLVDLYPISNQIDSEIPRIFDNLSVYALKKENRLILSPSSEDAVLSAFGSDIQFYRESFGIIPNKNKYIYIKIIIFFLFCVILFYYFHKLY